MHCKTYSPIVNTDIVLGIHTNFKNNYKGKALKDQLWKCARATYKPAFNKEMELLKAMSPGAYGFFRKIAPEHWSRAHFRPIFKCDMLLNNLCECFNSVILGARSKGIVTLNEIIRTKLMCRIQKKRDAMQKCGSEYCARIMKKLEKAKALSFTYSTTWSGGAQYQVLGNEGQFVVDRIEKTCSCRKWQLTGVPCAHAISALYYNQDRPENYIDEC